MQCRTRFVRARTVALVAGMMVLASFAMAAPSFAAPPAGTACVASDGKITGRGATFQTTAQRNAFIVGYNTDVCGATPGTPADIAGNNMIAYNQTGPTGSGNGQIAMTCRTDAFGGSDIPYDQATLNILNGPKGTDIPGQSSPFDVNQCATLSGTSGNSYRSPFGPLSSAPYPDTNDQNGNIMVFPVAGSSVAIGVHFATPGAGKVCTSGVVPTTVTISNDQLQKIFGGLITTWSGLTNNATCTGPITRYVRSSKSGTTQTFKNYLHNVNGTLAQCDGSSWNNLALDANNTVWPDGSGTCPSPSNLVQSANTGGGALTTNVQAGDGAIGYADLADWNGHVTGGNAVKLITLQPATGGAAVGPGSPTGSANCVNTFKTANRPGSGAADAQVSLAPSPDNWALDGTGNAGRSYTDLTFQGGGYPICGLTYDMVYTGLSSSSGGADNPISRLTNDQRRTLYTYMTYILSPPAQARLTTIGYDQLPSAWLPNERQGFVGNF
jgi:ABC-type phosphate transport system substrate-binding protein